MLKKKKQPQPQNQPMNLTEVSPSKVVKVLPEENIG